MIPMGEEVELHLSLDDRNHLHQGFHMEAYRNFIFSHFSSVGTFYIEGKGVDASCEIGKGNGGA